ncbi:hypothetical protein IE81DRAFT_326121 [Ceraceosorus guamensis]|uniref:Uncharacterized protein n=1 Tax=Ceraceosorus guamensis TaxID=1522189 RepID=A0A316VQE1_9BASI|nr:hypothetical protein IE81DRAFT_326121 [Ceraceosorus guamensis]PWN39859.1 hypothetical protein IE81DRAFT_326121 [Ceraceosorus guamensis]
MSATYACISVSATGDTATSARRCNATATSSTYRSANQAKQGRAVCWTARSTRHAAAHLWCQC